MDDRQSPDLAAASAVALQCLEIADDSRGPSPTEVVLLHEDRAEEWHYDEAIHKARLMEHRALSVAFKERERQAKVTLGQQDDEHQQQIANLLATAEAEERRCGLELAGLREEFVEAKHQIAELEELCEQDVRDLEEQMRSERQRRAALEQDLAKERLSVERATGDIAAIEDREGEMMRMKRTRMAENRSACQRQCLDVQRSGEREIQELSRGLREEVDAIQIQIDQKKKENKLGVNSWVKRRCDFRDETEKQIIQTVDSKVTQGLASVQMQALETREASLEKIKEVQVRDFEKEAILTQHITAAFVSVGCSVQERDQIPLFERQQKKQLEAATEILLEKPKNRNNSQRLRNAGTLALGS